MEDNNRIIRFFFFFYASVECVTRCYPLGRVPIHTGSGALKRCHVFLFSRPLLPPLSLPLHSSC